MLVPSCKNSEFFAYLNAIDLVGETLRAKLIPSDLKEAFKRDVIEPLFRDIVPALKNTTSCHSEDFLIGLVRNPFERFAINANFSEPKRALMNEILQKATKELAGSLCPC